MLQEKGSQYAIKASSKTRKGSIEPMTETMNAPLTHTAKLLEVIAQLRNPETGCPWDLKQTHQSLAPYMLEEAYEAVDAIDSNNPNSLKDELGDVLLQVVLHAQLAQEANAFNFEDIAQHLSQKMVERHPHVFKAADTTAIYTPEAVTQQWEEIKTQTTGKENIWDKPPKHLPALMQTDKISQAAVKEGFKWPNLENLWACVASEVQEVKETLPLENQLGESKSRQEEEIGDLLFALVSLAGQLKINPEIALNKATNKFITRYKTLKSLTNQPISDYSFEALDNLWKQAKALTSKA